MTRKRFVKLLMAKGYSRNSANGVAEAVRANGKTYVEAYKAVKATVDITQIISETVVKLYESIGRIARALSAGFAAFSAAYSSAMAGE